MYQLQEYKSFFGVERKSESNLWLRKKPELPLEVAFHTEQNKVSRAFCFLGMTHRSIPSWCINKIKSLL